jgi:hypothetical protein
MRRLDRWRWIGAVLFACGGIVGCAQHHFMTEADFKHLNKQALCGVTGPNLEEAADLPRSPQQTGVRTILSPEAKQRDISLAECLAIALEKGRTGENFRNFTQGGLPLSPGSVGGQATATDALRVFAFDPAIRRN